MTPFSWADRIFLLELTNVIFDDTYALIDLDILSANFRAIREKAGVPVMAVIKADAYGHGAVPLARHLEQDCGFFAVSSLAEAMELRNAGIQKPILVFGHIHRNCIYVI